jgi:predicted HAD superfamily Cof-like phosphohydrolase
MTDKFYNGKREQLSNFENVGVFMHSFGQVVKTRPELPSLEVQKLRYELINEELTELHCGMVNEDLVEIADALADLLYVVYGAGHAYGIDLDKCFSEVHRSNMSKLGADGKPVYREDGKVMKGSSYSPPDLESIIKGDNNGKETNN